MVKTVRIMWELKWLNQSSSFIYYLWKFLWLAYWLQFLGFIQLNLKFFVVFQFNSFNFKSNTYENIASNSNKVLKFNRYALVFDYFNKPILPPPLSVFYYIYILLKDLICLLLQTCFGNVSEQGKYSKIKKWFLQKYISGFCNKNYF